MSTDGVDTSRRRFLTAASTVVGGAGVVGALVPFVAYMNPSAKAKAAGAPVEVDISKLETGAMLRVEWRGKPVWILKRSEENMKDLGNLADLLTDPGSETPQQPTYATNQFRARKDRADILVAVGICTHLGCSPQYRPDVAPADLGPEWKGGFFCSCHGSKFDLAGRVYKGVPAPSNLVIPPYQYLSKNVILVGDDGGVA